MKRKLTKIFVTRMNVVSNFKDFLQKGSSFKNKVNWNLLNLIKF